nr:MAG TPA: hypothetical protein [Bacteriophage sp.]
MLYNYIFHLSILLHLHLENIVLFSLMLFLPLIYALK